MMVWSSQAEASGPFAVGGGDWSLVHEKALLLVDGGTGIPGWLPALASANFGGYWPPAALDLVGQNGGRQPGSERLPWRRTGVQVTIFITQASSLLAVYGSSRCAQRSGAKQDP